MDFNWFKWVLNVIITLCSLTHCFKVTYTESLLKYWHFLLVVYGHKLSDIKIAYNVITYYTEHCSVGPTKLIETIASTTRMTVYADEKVYGFLNLDF